MKRVAVIGLGIMGRGIVRNFLKNGYEVTVWNRSPERSDELANEGARKAATVAEAVLAAEVVFEVTANNESSRQMWQGADGIIATARPKQVLVTSATLSASWVDELAAECSGAGLTFFDMPMTGGRIGAETGNLSLLVGGEQEKLAPVEPVLKAIASKVTYFGKAGSGTRYKLVLNTLQAIHIAGFGEVMRMAIAAGLNPNIVGPALVQRPGGVPTELAWDGYQSPPDPINFSVEWIHKDLDYASRMIDSNTPTPLLSEVLGEYGLALNAGKENSDWTSIVRDDVTR